MLHYISFCLLLIRSRGTVGMSDSCWNDWSSSGCIWRLTLTSSIPEKMKTIQKASWRCSCACVWGYFQAFTCVTFICICSCVAYFAVAPPLTVVLFLHLKILISLSWCSTPGLSCGQIAALFISLVINITRCTATFAGNNPDNGDSALLSLFCLFLLPASLL